MTLIPTIEADKSVGSVLGAAEWNVNCLQMARYTQEVLAGTNATKIPGSAMTNPFALPGTASFGDINFNMQMSAGDAFLVWDSTDYFTYSRSGNKLNLVIGGVGALTINGNGRLTGAGTYDSGQVSIANGVTQNFATSFPAGDGPAFAWGLYGASAGNVNFPVGTLVTGAVRFNATTNAGVQCQNNTGSTQLVRVWAMTSQ